MRGTLSRAAQAAPPPTAARPASGGDHGGGDDTPTRPEPPPPTHVWRVGGGFEYERGEQYTEAVAGCAVYDTYRSLPPADAAHSATDVALLAEVLRSAEAEADASAGVTPGQQATLAQVLRAHQRVLRVAGLDPESDTRCYRTLLRLSLDRHEACWWGRLYREVASNCRRFGASPEQQEALLSALLRCRAGEQGDAEDEEEAAVAARARDVVQGSRPGSPGFVAPPSDPLSHLLWAEGQAAAAAAPAPAAPPDIQRDQQAPAAEAPSLSAAASFASQAPAAGVDAQQARCLQQALHAWQQASAATAAAPGQGGAASFMEHGPVEDAVAASSPALQRPGSMSSLPQRRGSAQPSTTVRVPLPQAVNDTCTWAGLAGAAGGPAYPELEPLPAWAPWQCAWPCGGSSSPDVAAKYPPIHGTPAAAAAAAAAAGSTSNVRYSDGGWPESPRILAQPPAAQPSHPAVQAHKQAVLSPCTPEQRLVLADCWESWRGLASASAAAQRVADLRGSAWAEEFREEQLARLCFRAWRHRRRLLLAEVLGRMGSAKLRHAFLQWRGSGAAAAELDRRACLHYNAVMLRQALKAWRLASTFTKGKRLACLAALAHFQGRMQGILFAAWRCAAAQEAGRDKLAAARFQRRRVLACWRQQARRQAVLARYGAALAQKSAGTVLRAHLRAWRGATQRRCQGRDKMHRCMARLANRQLCLAFGRWRDVVQKRQAARLCATRLRMLQTAAALRSWRQWTAARQAARERAAACLQRMLRWRLAAAWQGWRSRTAAWRAARERLQRCVAQLKSGSAARAWRAWRHAVSLRQLKAAKLQHALGHWQSASLSAAFQRWQQAHAEQAAKRALLRSCIARLSRGAAARAWAEWREEVGARAQRRSAGERCILRLQQLARARAWSQWRARVQHKAARRAIVEGFQPRHHARICREALTAWATEAAEEARLRNGTAIRCLQHWQATTQQRRRLRHVAGQAVGRLSQLSAARVLAAWRAWLGERQGQAARLRAAVGLWRTCQLRSCFALWQEHVQKRRQQRELLQHAVQRMVGLKMRSAWNAWAALVDERRAASDRLLAAVSAWQLCLLRKAFQTWRERHAEKSEHRRRLGLAVSRWQRSTLSAAWQAWAAYACERRGQKAVLAAAVSRLLNVRLAAAWGSWREAAQWRRSKADMASSAVGFWLTRRMGAAFATWHVAGIVGGGSQGSSGSGSSAADGDSRSGSTGVPPAGRLPGKVAAQVAAIEGREVAGTSSVQSEANTSAPRRWRLRGLFGGRR